MESRVGANAATSACVGAVPVREIRLGSVLVWKPLGIFDDFDRADATALSTPWINETPAAAYDAGIIAGKLQMWIPANPLSWYTTESRFRHNLKLPADGYLQVQVAAKGATGLITQVLRRYTDAGTGTAGVGLDLRGSAAAIVSRVNSVDTLHKCGSFVSGDVLRLTSAGRLHTLWRNGVVAGSWNDANLVALEGTGYESLGVRMQGRVGIFDPKQTSPPLHYIHVE